MPLQVTQLQASTPPLYIISYNASKTKTGITSIKNNLLSASILSQIGQTSYAEFKDDFINYKSGLILCCNTPVDLNKIFSTSAVAASTGNLGVGIYASLPNNVVFKVVRMPAEFINQKGNLTKDYEYGEKLFVISTKETSSIGNSIYQIPALAPQPKSPVSGGLVSYIIYRDSNARGRSVKAKSTGGGGGIGVWS